ncbi:uncharacterized protein BN496_01375 [Bacteroides sp. CAG:144]|nr:uncharacterized protein BN496_01375 [Bacteroides sp. CAG:144]
MQQNGRYTCFENQIDMLFFEYDLTFYHNFVALNRNNLASIFVGIVFHPSSQNTGGQTTADGFFEVGLRNFHLFGQTEDFENVFIAFETYGTQQCRYGQFLLTIDIGIHHIVDVGSELYPRTFERNDSRRIKFRSVSVDTLSEEHAGRTVQLRHNNTFGTIDYKCTFFGHIRDRTEVYILYNGVEIFVIGVGAIKLEFCFQRHTVCESAFQTLIDGVTWRIDIIIEKFEDEVVTGICNREILCKNLIKTFIFTFLGWGVQLQKVFERFQLHFEEIGIWKRILDRSKVYPRFTYILRHLSELVN